MQECALTGEKKNMKNKTQRMQMICDLMKDEHYVPMKEKELAVFLQVRPEDREEFKSILNELLKENRITLSKRGRYSKPEEIVVNGTFVSHANGFGFVEVEDREEDLFVPKDYVHDALHGDVVQAKILPGKRGKRTEAEIIQILERGTKTLVGTYQSSKNYGFVVPDNNRFTCDVFVPKERSKGAVDGHKVVVEITDYGNERRNPEGKVTQIIGHRNDPGVDIMSIVLGYDLPTEFPEKVLSQAERVAKPVSEADLVGRRDLRGMQMVTIDGPDAKDLDDAVSLSIDEKGYHLGVHIADVTNYVQENSALDHDALARGTSVYLVDRVIPMIPHTLSNGICSLNAGEDRLALSALMTIDESGEVTDYEIVESVINVNRRMSYPVVAKILEEHPEDLVRDHGALVPMFEDMAKLAKILRAKRKKRGSIDFDFPESKIYLDENGKPLEIKPYERNVATDLIEEFMLIANETVAQHFYWQELPFVYRTHDNPDPEKIHKLATFIYNFGYSIKLKQEEIHPKEIQKLVAKVQGTPEEAMISRLALRSMKQAKYTPDCTGHFGLACKYYCHFTSPIRRYPDLQIHRIIKDSLRGRLKGDKIEHYRTILPDVAMHCSKKERIADEAERETDKLKKVEYMEDHIGEVFEGVISGVTNFGIYVELPNTVEGMVHISKLPGDFFHYDEERYELVGEHTDQTYKLGQKVQVEVVRADRFERVIDFAIAEDDIDE